MPDQDRNKKMANCIKIVKGGDAKPLVISNANPILNTAQYLVEMSDGLQMEIMVNIIVECMYYQVDSEGSHHQLVHKIVGHKKDKSAIKKS